VKGSDRSLIRGTFSAFVWRNWGKSRKILVRITGLQTGRMEHVAWMQRNLLCVLSADQWGPFTTAVTLVLFQITIWEVNTVPLLLWEFEKCCILPIFSLWKWRGYLHVKPVIRRWGCEEDRWASWPVSCTTNPLLTIMTCCVSIKVTCYNSDIGVSLRNEEYFTVTCIYFKRWSISDRETDIGNIFVINYTLTSVYSFIYNIYLSVYICICI
jgi:hypothetical protein